MAALCTRCRRPIETPDFRPFCSERCRDIDLGHWLSGRYAVPAAPEDEAAGEDDEAFE